MKYWVVIASVALVTASCANPSATSKPTPTDLVSRGMSLADSKGCTGCHTVDGTKGLGPTWKGLFGSMEALDDGSIVDVDPAYLRRSMLEPSAQTVKGYEAGLMETSIKPNSLTDQEVKALIAYIESLR